MVYLWEGVECPDKHVAEYDMQVSPYYSLLRKAAKLSEGELGRCYCYLRSTALDLPDDPFLRLHLRRTNTVSYIFTPDELFYFDGAMANTINISLEQLKKLQRALSLTDENLDQEPKTLTDDELAIIATFIEYPVFNRRPVLRAKATISELQKKYDCIQTGLCQAPLVNQKIIDILVSLAPDEVQFFDAEIHCKDGLLTGYKLLNLTSKIKGIDYDQSVCEVLDSLPGFVYGFKKVAYKAGCLGHHKLVRDEEYLSHILVAEEIRLAFKEAKVTGVRLVKPEDLYPTYRPRNSN